MIYKDTHYCQITPVPPTSFPVLPGSPHTPCANHNTCSFFFLTFYTRKNVNSLRYADDTTLLAQSEDKLKNRLMRVQEESEKRQIFIFLGSKITADSDCSHEIKRYLLLGRKVMTNLDSILKSRDIILPTKACLVKAVVFPVVIYGYESWTTKKAEHQIIDAFELWCWRRLLRVSWTARISNQSILKEISSNYSLKGLMLRLKLPILWPPDAKS